MQRLARLINVGEQDLRPLIWACCFNFSVMAAYFVIRPLRDEMGVASGVRSLPWLFSGTLAGMLLVHPLFGAAVSRLGRRGFIPLAYRFFAGNLVVFWALFSLLPAGSAIWTGRVFFIWTSVFNLFVVSVFWSTMADRFAPDSGNRLFGLIAVGGTMGAIVGSAVTGVLAALVRPTHLLLLSVVLLEIAVQAARQVFREEDRESTAVVETFADGEESVGGSALDGVLAVFRSPYLVAVCAYMFLYTLTATFLYFQQAEIVGTELAESAARTVFFARVDLAVNTLTVVTQVLLTGRLVRALGVGLGLAFLPVICILGFSVLAWAPSLAVIALFQILRRSSNYAVSRPCREMLYTVLPREEKYKAKNFVDTFVYRTGDQLGAWSYAALAGLGIAASGIALIAAPISACWVAVGYWLGRRHDRLARPLPTSHPIRAR